MTKQEFWEMDRQVLETYMDADHMEYLDYLTEASPEMFDKTLAWKMFEGVIAEECLVLNNYFNRPSKSEVFSEDIYWDKSSPLWVGYSSYEDYENYLTCKEEESLYIKELEWHHIPPDNIPDWKILTDKLTQLI